MEGRNAMLVFRKDTACTVVTWISKREHTTSLCGRNTEDSGSLCSTQQLSLLFQNYLQQLEMQQHWGRCKET